ncbi:MAG: hypothetical protein WC886_08615 [Saccharofermentanaceae bacterium]|jgi:hypothetical protein
MAKETVTKTSTKNEIFDAYETLLKKVVDLETLKPQEIKEKEDKQALVKKVSDITSDNIVKGIAELKLKLGSSLDQVEESLMAEHKKLNEIRQAIDIQKTLIDDLYKVKITADSLAAMLLAHKEKKQQIEAEEQELKLELQQLRDEFDTEMGIKKNDWDKEKIRIQLDIKEEKERLKKEHQREEDDYTYNLQIKRRKEQDEYAEKRRKTELDFLTKTGEKEKALSERENAVQEKEEAFALLQEKVSKFDDELAKTIKITEKTLTERLTAQFGFEKELQLKEQEGLIKLKEQTIQTLESRIKEQESYIKQLTQKTKLADKSVKDIAIKAIESSGKVQLFDATGGKKE